MLDFFGIGLNESFTILDRAAMAIEDHDALSLRPD